MEFPQMFTNLYIRHSLMPSFKLVFYNRNSRNVLAFDGIFFASICNANFDDSLFEEVDYSAKKGWNLTIEAVKSDYEISLIKYADGDIFQIGYMMDDESSKQRIEVYSAGQRGYLMALTRFQQLEFAEMEELKPGSSVNEWLKIESS